MKKLSIVTIIAMSLLQASQARTFTNTEGRKIDAVITKVDGDKVELKLTKTGSVHLVDIVSLSKNDQDYVKSWKPSATEPDAKQTEEKTDAPANELMGTSFDKEWPDAVSGDRGIEIKVVTEDEANKKYVYHSPNYEFVCDVKLSMTIVKKFAILFEATRDYCKALPIEMLKVPKNKEARDKVLLFESRATYVKNGAPPTSAGVYMPRNNIVMVPLTSLGVKKVGSGYMFDYKGVNKTLPHEITHQLTIQHYYAPGAMGWFSEGLAEYVATTPYNSGRYGVKTAFSSIRAYATEYGKKDNGGRALGKEFSAPDLKSYMLQPYSSFAGKNANFNYGLGLLLTYYFFHMEEDRTNINNFLRALKSGEKGEVALNQLLNERTWTELEEEIYAAWRKRGVKINFK